MQGMCQQHHGMDPLKDKNSKRRRICLEHQGMDSKEGEGVRTNSFKILLGQNIRGATKA